MRTRQSVEMCKAVSAQNAFRQERSDRQMVCNEGSGDVPLASPCIPGLNLLLRHRRLLPVENAARPRLAARFLLFLSADISAAGASGALIFIHIFVLVDPANRRLA